MLFNNDINYYTDIKINLSNNDYDGNNIKIIPYDSYDIILHIYVYILKRPIGQHTK